jgi:hypothetical protein
MTLTERQRSILQRAAADVPPAQIDAFDKFITDVLRSKREIWDSDVSHAVCAALVKYGARRA